MSKFTVSVSDVKRILVRDIAESSGIELKRAGFNKHVGLCPFHDETTPSFTIFEKSNRWKCFGCGLSGDVIDLVQKIKGCSFKEAVRELTGDTGVKWVPPDQNEAMKRDRIKAFREWERNYSEILCQWVAAANRMLFRLCLVPDDLDRFANLIRNKAVAENHLDVLAYGSDRHKFELFRAIKSGNGGCYA